MSEENKSRLEGAIEQLRNHQTQLDADGIMVGVSREALDMALAAFSDPKAEAVTVKPLVWEVEGGWRHIGKPPARFADFCYWVMDQDKGYMVPTLKKTYPTLEEAKAAAQADYEARILSAIYTSPVPALTDEAVERAYEAAKNAMPHEALSEIAPGELERVALAAFPSKGEGE